MQIITTHRNTDFDALASVFAASLLYPEAVPVLPRSLNPNARAFLSIHKDHFPSSFPNEVPIGDTTRLILVDANRWNRLEGMEGLIGRPDLEIHIWDHHVEQGDIDGTWSRTRPVGATATLLVAEMEKAGRSLSPVHATLFLAGIYEDTGNLLFPSTTAEDARAAAFLLEQEADLTLIRTFLRSFRAPAQKEILFEMLKTEKRVVNEGFSVSLLGAKIEGHTPGLSEVVDTVQEILGVDAAFGIFADTRKNQCIVIGRSTADTLNIGALLSKMGGGGHPNAGSALVKAIEPEKAEEWLIRLITGDHRASVQISDLMSFPVHTVTPQTTMEEVALLFRERGFTGLPVVHDHTLVGVVSRRDFKRVRGTPHLKAPVKAFMSTKVIHVSPQSSVVEAVRLMVRHDIGRLPVVENGRLLGIVTRSDAMRYYYNLLPE